MKIVLATGGTGGHLFPALQVAGEFKKRGHEVFFFGSFGFGKKYLEKEGYPFEDLQIKGLSRHDVLKNVLVLWLMIKALLQSIAHLKRLKPAAVMGFGGYGSFPVVLAACLMRLPTMIHEQNVVPGKANILLSQWVKDIAVSFEETRCYFSKKNVILTGCPCRVSPIQKSRRELCQRFHLEEGKKTILVCGGSQGSHPINQVFMNLLETYQDRIHFQMIHLCGEKDYHDLKQRYEGVNGKNALFSFIEDMDQAYTLADVVVARAGAVTVTELVNMGKRAIFIPYPHADGHQKENALVLSQKGMADVIEEKDLKTETLFSHLTSMLNSSISEEEVANRLRTMRIGNPEKRIVQAVLEKIT